MTKSLLRYRLSHLVVRLVAIFNIAALVFGTLHPTFFQALRRLQLLNEGVAKWLIASTLLIPLYVAFEAWWMRNAKSERREILIDAALALAWFFTLWGFVLYGWTHYAPI